MDINTIETNFRAEVVASALIEEGQEPEKILIYRHKGDKKDVSKDIDKLAFCHSGFDMMEYLHIHVNRNGIYESLPEGLFHETSGYGKANTKEDIIRDIKEQREKESLIRRFFQPFEMILDNVLIEAQAYEQKYDKIHFYDNLAGVIKEYWDILRYLSTGQALLFIKAVPVIAEASRDLSLTANIISMILDCSVSVREDRKSDVELEPGDCIKLREWKLGINSVLDKGTRNAAPDITVSIGPVDLGQMRLFESNRNNDLILKELLNLTVPFNRNISINYRTIQSETKFRLSGEGHTAYLGVNTTL